MSASAFYSPKFRAECVPIHMNGRTYDPKLGRFIQADPFIQAPKDSQSLNRYTYVNNNPLSYSDPTGYFLSSLWKKIRPYVSIAVMVVGMIVAPELAPLWGAMSGFISSGNIKGAVIGAFSAMVFQGIGNGFAKLASSAKYASAAAQNVLRAGKILAHGIAGGVMSELNGGNFGHGFWAAGFTQAFAPAIDGIDVGNAGFSAGRTVAAAVVGGTASELSGGKFANGAVTGAFSRAFNDELHQERPHSFGQKVKRFFNRVNRVVDVQVSAGAQVGIKTSIPGGAKVDLTVNGLAAEKELTDGSSATIIREFTAAVGVPLVGDFSVGTRQTDVLGILPNDPQFSYGYREFSISNEGAATFSLGVAAGLGINIDVHLDQVYDWITSSD